MVIIFHNLIKIINFDLDNTLLNIDSDFEWSLFIVKLTLIITIYKKNIFFINSYNKNTLNVNKYNTYILNKNKIFIKTCYIFNILVLFFNKIIKNKINNKILLILNIIKINYKTFINTSTNKNISKIINFKFNLKLSEQSNNTTKVINNKLIYIFWNTGLLNYKSNKLKNIFIKINNKSKIIYSDSLNDLKWIKKKLLITNPDKLLLNNILSYKNYIIFKKKSKNLFN